jgi:hypothetical protein
VASSFCCRILLGSPLSFTVGSSLHASPIYVSFLCPILLHQNRYSRHSVLFSNSSLNIISFLCPIPPHYIRPSHSNVLFSQSHLTSTSFILHLLGLRLLKWIYRSSLPTILPSAPIKQNPTSRTHGKCFQHFVFACEYSRWY